MYQPRILLIDDDEAFLALFLSLKKAREFDITPLTSAGEALDVLDRESVDLIISDVEMPEMTGVESLPEPRISIPTFRSSSLPRSDPSKPQPGQ